MPELRSMCDTEVKEGFLLKLFSWRVGMYTLDVVLIGSIVFLSALLIGMALMLRKQWEPENAHSDKSKRLK